MSLTLQTHHHLMTLDPEPLTGISDGNREVPEACWTQPNPVSQNWGHGCKWIQHTPVPVHLLKHFYKLVLMTAFGPTRGCLVENKNTTETSTNWPTWHSSPPALRPHIANKVCSPRTAHMFNPLLPAHIALPGLAGLGGGFDICESRK